MKIKSLWKWKTGKWDSNKNDFVDIKIKANSKNIEMKIIGKGAKKILKFIGGPTGFESYYIKDLLEHPPKSNILCICGGTVNSWPRCEVNTSEVFQYINSWKKPL